MSKKVMAVIKLILPAGKATPSYPVGPALGPYGVNMMGFVNDFNKRTTQDAGLQIPVDITIYADRSFVADIKRPTVASMLRRAAGVDKGSSTPKRETAGQISRKQVYEIAEGKIENMNTGDMDAAARIVMGTARSMGLKVVD
ncbi:50S ribosomal protein L11 [Haliangium ochraceum]|uniref:Large ribosomal subunit protein uL11 n=1 Tax=Haliangium ochraceum (strain DSM 14365 / JCM 11303 / SMP-2) TaxID=502025 RepID=D0LTU6_HALO1|nr:50S ribosomal protein L11 [Haliangium ochraceum]ACY15790.1 ribosomal protein L11 [Haliangium ochraceum DSM 14365]